MPEYRITFSRSAERELHRLDALVRRRVLSAIERLTLHPRPVGCRKLAGSKNDWRIRADDWRVIDDTRANVDIVAIRHRSDAYR
jgi:mRNA interferase RelE/StbE